MRPPQHRRALTAAVGLAALLLAATAAPGHDPDPPPDWVIRAVDAIPDLYAANAEAMIRPGGEVEIGFSYSPTPWPGNPAPVARRAWSPAGQEFAEPELLSPYAQYATFAMDDYGGLYAACRDLTIGATTLAQDDPMWGGAFIETVPCPGAFLHLALNERGVPGISGLTGPGAMNYYGFDVRQGKWTQEAYFTTEAPLGAPYAHALCYDADGQPVIPYVTDQASGYRLRLARRSGVGWTDVFLDESPQVPGGGIAAATAPDGTVSFAWFHETAGLMFTEITDVGVATQTLGNPSTPMAGMSDSSHTYDPDGRPVICYAGSDSLRLLKRRSDGTWIDEELPLFARAAGIAWDADGNPYVAAAAGNGVMLVSPQLTPGVTGDFDGDDAVDATDIDLLFNAVGQWNALHDLDDNDEIDAADVDVLVQDVLGTNYGDADLDGDVDYGENPLTQPGSDGVSDLNILIQNAGTTSGAGWADADFDGDGDVDYGENPITQPDGDGVSDLNILIQNVASNPAVGADQASGAAELVYNEVTGEAWLDNGGGGIVQMTIYTIVGGVDTGAINPFFTKDVFSAQDEQIIFFDEAGLPVGEDSIGVCLDPGLTPGAELAFYYQADGGQVTQGEITVVPEPAAMVLLALGGAALIRRKK